MLELDIAITKDNEVVASHKLSMKPLIFGNPSGESLSKSMVIIFRTLHMKR
jgi:glycerophosphoryl diester phosphodiesterase